MSKARDLIHDMVNSLSIGYGMARILESGLKQQREMSDQDKLDKMKKIMMSLEKLEQQIQELRTLAKDSNW